MLAHRPATEAVPMPSLAWFRTYLNRRILWSLLGCIYLVRRLAGPDRQIFVVPTPPTRWHVLWLIASYLGARFTTKPEKSQLGCIHEDCTWVEPRSATADWPKIVLNSRCLDITKTRVGEVSKEVLGYDCHVDPTRHVGPMVRKSDINGRHDGVIVEGPIEHPEPGYVYQLVIDNQTSETMVADFRLSIIGSRIPLAMIKRRHISIRFEASLSRVEIVDPTSLFSENELQQIAEVARIMGVEFGELDVLRDGTSQRIYVLDVNKTPASMLLNWRSNLKIVRLAARVFETEFLSSPAPMEGTR